MAWEILFCLVAAAAGAGYGWYSMARKEAENFKDQLVDGRNRA